jgi:1-acyl-sn-glycerol-3-phosphate acyltransferase
VAIAFGALTGFFSAAAIPAALVWRRRGIPWIARTWARLTLRVAGVSVDLGFEGPPLEGAPPMVVMANHTSHFDVVSLYATLPFAVRMVAKRELTYIPIFGWALALGAAIVIDRKSRQQAIASLERAGAVIRSGVPVLMFPEGTRTPPGVLGPLKKGPFHLALAARVPVLPIGIQGTGEILQKGSWRIHPGRVTLRIGTPIPTHALPDDDQGRAQLAEVVGAALADLGRLEAQPGPSGIGLDTPSRHP